MICIKCGYDTKVLSTRELLTIKTSRRRECLNCGHHFTTIEVPTRAVQSNFGKGFATTVARIVARREYDIKMAQDLHLGWQHLAQLHNISKSGVYYAAARGRKYLQLQQKEK